MAEIIHDDFVGFTFNGIHSSELGIIRTAEGKTVEQIGPAFQDSTKTVLGKDGTYYYDTNYTNHTFDIPIAFDDMSESQLRRFRQVFCGKARGELVFDEVPYKHYKVKLAQAPVLNFVCFDVEKNGQVERVYKGDTVLNFIAYYPYAVCGGNNRFLENYEWKLGENLSNLITSGTRWYINNHITSFSNNSSYSWMNLLVSYGDSFIYSGGISENPGAIIYPIYFLSQYENANAQKNQTCIREYHLKGQNRITNLKINIDSLSAKMICLNFVNTPYQALLYKRAKFQWEDGAELLLSPVLDTSIVLDKFYSPYAIPLTGNWIYRAYVYNPGDMKTGFQLGMDASVFNKLVKIEYGLIKPNEINHVETFLPLKILEFNDIEANSNDIYINSSSHLIEEYKNLNPTGKLYNKYIKAGDFFQLFTKEELMKYEESFGTDEELITSYYHLGDTSPIDILPGVRAAIVLHFKSEITSPEDINLTYNYLYY